MALDAELVKLLVVEAAECGRQAAQGADQPKLPGESVDHEAKPAFLGKLEAFLGFALHVDERVTRREKVGDQVVAAQGREREVADGVRDIERATDQIAAGADMLGPRHDEIAERPHKCEL